MSKEGTLGKRKIISFVGLILFLCISFASVSYAKGNGSTKVYVTKTGGCYHRENCSYLRSSIEITLEEAHLMYRPCSRCKPPVYDEYSYEIDEERYKRPGADSSENSPEYSANNTMLESQDNSWIFLLVGGGVVYAYFKVKEHSKRKNEFLDICAETDRRIYTKSDERKAYRTPTGNVYHVRLDCEGLQQSNSQIVEYKLEKARKEWRRPCAVCGKGEVGVWNSYHKTGE